MLLLQQAREFIHEGTGAYESALGQQATNAKSGRAVLALQNQHMAGSSHFLDNLAEISMTYEAKVVLDLIPHIYDRPGRVARILDREDRSKTVMLNQPFRVNPQTQRPVAVPSAPPAMPPMGPMGQPGMPPPGMPPMGMPPMARPQGKVLNYELNKGRYGVSVSIGKSYKSRNEEGADEMGNLFQANPALFPILGDIYLKFRDFPGHLEAAERVKKMLPPPLQAQGAEPDPQQLQQQLQQASQMVEQLGKALDEKTKLLESDGQKLQQQAQVELQKQDMILQQEREKLQAQTVQAQSDQQAKIEIERMRNETQLAITAMKIRADEANAALAAAIKKDTADTAHDATLMQQAAKQGHEQDMADRDRLDAEHDRLMTVDPNMAMPDKDTV